MNQMATGTNPASVLYIYVFRLTYFLLHGKDKFPLDEGYESKFTLEVRIWLAAHTCRSGIGPSPADSGG